MKKYAQFLAIFVLIALVLATILNGAVRSLVVEPLMELVWLIQVFAQMVPQALIWGILLLFAMWMAWRSLASPMQLWHRGSSTSQRTSSILSWQHSFQNGATDDYSRQKLAQRLGQLCTEVLNSHNPETPQTLWECLRDQHNDMPADVRAYLKAGVSSTASTASSKGWGKAAAPNPDLQLDPERVLQFLEQRLYMQSDQDSPRS